VPTRHLAPPNSSMFILNPSMLTTTRTQPTLRQPENGVWWRPHFAHQRARLFCLPVTQPPLFRGASRATQTAPEVMDGLKELLAQLGAAGGDPGMGLHSSTSQLNLSALYGIGDARRGCVARVKGVLGGV
jgi:hypothetical protein